MTASVNSENIFILKPESGQARDALYCAASLNIAPHIRGNILFLHVFSGGYNTSALFRQGKKKFMNVLNCNKLRLFTKALNDFEKSEFDLSINERILKLRLSEEKAKVMLEMEESYKVELIKTENNETIINNEFDESECYIDKWRISEYKLASLLAGKDSSSVDSESFIQNSALRYPKLKLPTFDGNIKNWLRYWSQLKKIDTNPNLDDHDKFANLLQSVEKVSSAEELIKSFPPGGESYSKALQQLQSRFGKEDLLKEVYVRDLLSLVLLKNSKQKFSLRTLYDNLQSKLRALEVLGYSYKCG
ncbi:hypothetical protein AVEN_80765-1 [Araneus ventricosus]|uniref:Uncharacterized protein n=1 Tax=Araneus ventricosus TaxID=182803 RepID=A0A4Y2I4K0_ARAVE|nr:hypothetical protein AVEN_80765-1 [Araneus ventricosus]